MNMNINRYEIFLKTVETGNITKAAEALNYTQSGISHAIAALEKETGFSLFIRSSNGVTLTENGKRLLEPVRNLVNQQRHLAQSIADLNNTVAGIIRVGTFTSVSVQWLPQLIRSFQALYPLVEFELLDGNYDEIAERILTGRIDCGFSVAPVPESLYFLPLRRDPMLVILNPKHPLAKKKAVSPAELSKEPFIMATKGLDNDVQEVLKNTSTAVHLRYTLNNDISVMSLVASGFGISLMPELLLRPINFELARRPLDPPQYRTIGIASLPMRAVSVITKTFLNYLADEEVQRTLL